MPGHPFSTTESYRQSIRGLHRLHALTLEGQAGSPMADAVRDSLESFWYDLSDVEQTRITGLSEDLYSISDPIEPPLPMNPQAQRALSEIMEARQAGEWDRALELLRHWSRSIDPTRLAYLRGSVYERAGDDGTAAIFYQHANNFNSETYVNLVDHLRSLHESDSPPALSFSQRIIATSQDHPPER